MQDNSSQKVLKNLSPGRILLPVAIGMAVALYMFVKNVNIDEVTHHLSNANLLWIAASLGVLLLMDMGYMYRLRQISGKELSWTSCVYVILLWEFASAVSPPFIGGTAVTVFLINREGIGLGKAFAFVLLGAFLDDTFFVIAPLVAILVSDGNVFPDISSSQAMFEQGLKPTFWLSYGLYAVYAVFFGTGLFLKPKAFRWLLAFITSVKFLKRWQRAAIRNGSEIVEASKTFKGKSAGYWLQVIVATVFVWSARYFVLNSLLAAFSGMSTADHLLAFGRHIILWLVMMIAPTPGSSGIAELIFPAFFGNLLGSFSAAVALLWRLVTYYPYLFMGMILLPRWVRRVFTAKNQVISKAEVVKSDQSIKQKFEADNQYFNS